MSSRSPAGGIALSLAVAALVGGAALYAGATTAIGRTALAALAALVAAIGAFAPRIDGGARVRRLCLFVGALAALAFVQTLPLPLAVARAVAPYATTSREAVLGTEGGVRISLDADASRRAALLLGALACLLAVVGTRIPPRAAPTLARALALVGIGQAALGLWVGRYGQRDLLYGGFECSNPLSAYGSFPNRAQFAAFEVVLLGASFVLLGTRRGLLDRLLGLVALCAGAVSVATSGSRAGVAGVATATGAAWLLCAEPGRRRLRLAVLGAALLGLLGARVAGVDALVRALPLRGDESVRLDIWRGSVALAARQPVAGIGFDAFGWAYPGEGREPADRFVTVAENDVLHLAAEGGLVGLALVAAGGLAALRGARSLARRASAPARREAWLSACGPLGLLPLTLSSVPLHAPAVAFATLAAGALVVALLREDDAGPAPG